MFKKAPRYIVLSNSYTMPNKMYSTIHTIKFKGNALEILMLKNVFFKYIAIAIKPKKIK